MFDNSDRTEIGAMGEFGLIQHLSQHFEVKNSKTFKGIGDDCAVIDCGDHFGLLTTDLLLEGVHFDLSFHFKFNFLSILSLFLNFLLFFYFLFHLFFIITLIIHFHYFTLIIISLIILFP